MVRLTNPYLEFFWSLPPWFRRGTSAPLATAELAMHDWLILKSAIACHFSWAVPTDEAINAIRGHTSNVIEIGCGSGYWAWLMQQAGITVTAVDKTRPNFAWHPVHVGNELEVSNHPDKALFLCWPPWGDAMAYRALKNYAGTHVIYVGEWLGGSAEPFFFTHLVKNFKAISGVAIPQWYMRDDSLIVFRRRSSKANA